MTCPYCGEPIEIYVDPGGGERQDYIEDCSVCCRPNLITLIIDDDGEVDVEVTQEYEA